MNLQTMEYFAVLARERSFTRAAEALHITQQSLSGHIAAVEQELGAQLVVRRTPLELTYAGRAFLRHAEAIRQEEQALRQELGDITGEQRGQLRIGVAFTRSKAILPDVVTAFQQEYPNVELCILENANEKFHRALLDGEIDLAIANFPPSLPELELEPMLVLRLPRKQAGQIRFAYRKKPYQWQLLSAFLRIARQCVHEA